MEQRFRHRKQELKRRAEFKKTKPVFLIVCEGEKTEPNYFRELRIKWRLTFVDVMIVDSTECGTDPKGIVEFAKSKYDKLRYEKRQIEKENVWCVFDRDAHDKFNEAINLAKDYGFSVGCSNPCFELWYLLHYQKQNRHIERDEAHRALRKWIPAYEKNKTDIFSVTENNIPEALKNAAFLRSKHEGDGSSTAENPSTQVDMLVISLEKAKTVR